MANTFYAVVNDLTAQTSGTLRVYRTTNGGFTWTQIFQHPSDRGGGAVLLSLTDPNLIYVKSNRIYNCDAFQAYAPLIFRSTNGGTTFTQMASTGLAQNSTGGTLGVDPINGAIYMVGTAGPSECSAPETRIPGLLRSTGGGASWSLYAQSGAGGIPNGTIITTALFIPTSRTFYLGTNGAGVLIGSISQTAARRAFDFDGDGKADVSVFRPSNGSWYILQSTLGFTGVQFGQSGDKPVAGDYDGDGKADVAVNRSGIWYILRSALGFTSVQFGTADDKLVPADYDGDSKTDVAVFRPSNGVWYLQQSTAGFAGIAFGLGTDLPTPADYDGDGKADVAVFRNGTWYLQRSTQGFTGVAFGVSTDTPIPNAYVR